MDDEKEAQDSSTLLRPCVMGQETSALRLCASAWQDAVKELDGAKVGGERIRVEVP